MSTVGLIALAKSSHQRDHATSTVASVNSGAPRSSASVTESGERREVSGHDYYNYYTFSGGGII